MHDRGFGGAIAEWGYARFAFPAHSNKCDKRTQFTADRRIRGKACRGYDARMPEQEMPPIVNAVVQVGLARMRFSVGLTAQSAYHPRMVLWVDASSGMILHFELGKQVQHIAMLVMASLEKLAGRIGGLPKQIQLRQTELARILRRALEPTGVEVVVRESLPLLDKAIDGMVESPRMGGKPKPGLLDVPGMTSDHVIAFAEAAKAFYDARPWRHLTDDDVIAIESPAGPQGTQFTQVLGAGGQTYGLGFVPTLERTKWSGTPVKFREAASGA